MDIKIYCGETVLKEDAKSHPYLAAVQAKEIVDDVLNTKRSILLNSNSIDFVSAIYYYVKGNNLPVGLYLFLNEMEVDTLEPLFEDWNRALDYVSIISNTN